MSMPVTAAQMSAPVTTNNSVIIQQPAPAEPAYITALRQAFEAAIASEVFTEDVDVVKKAIKALAIPDRYARFRRQFVAVATSTLLKKATVVNGMLAYPSEEAISAEIERLIDELKVKHKKEAKLAA